MNRFHKNKWVVLLPVVLLACLTLQVPGEDHRPAKEELKPIRKAYELILNNYYDPEALDKDELIQGAIEGLLDELPDEYNAVYSKEEYEEYRKRQEGSYEGIGMEIGKSGDHIKIISVFPDTPASRNGLSGGDVILEIDDKSTRNMTYREAFDALEGEKGTSVQVKVRHKTKKEETITLTRSEIKITPVELELLEGKKIALIDINLFNRQTPQELGKVLNKIKPETFLVTY